MKVNKRARKALDGQLPGEKLASVVQLVTRYAAHRSAQTGTAAGTSILRQPYFVDRGLNLDHQGCLHLFQDSWLAVTDRRLIFFAANPLALLPKPGKFVGEAALGTSTLNWWDKDKRWRFLHVAFDNDTWVGQAIARGDEADLLVQAWGDRAVHLAL